MVRSAIANLIQGNRFVDNGRGANFFVKRMSEVYILSLGNCGGEFDENRDSLLDFLSSSFNVIRENQFSRTDIDAIAFGNEHNTFQGNIFSAPNLEANAFVCRQTRHNSQADEHCVEDGEVSSFSLYAFGSVTK
jgi:hypothetical protein